MRTSDTFAIAAMTLLLSTPPAVAQDQPGTLPTSAAPEPGHHDGHHHFTLGRADAHAPIGVMGDHMHGSGQWMLSYRYMTMRMDDNRDGTDRLSDQAVRDRGFPVVPTRMDMQMHMFGGMFAPTDDLTLMVMVPYIVLEMDHAAGPTLGDVTFTTRSEGLGDTKLTGLFRLWDDGPHHLHFNAGIGLPTGAINQRDDTPAMADAILPYPMQLGSGTFDLLPGVTYLYQQADWSLGTQVSGVVRLGRNYRGYSLGDQLAATAWAGYAASDAVSVSGRLAYRAWADVDGADPALNPAMVPTADPTLRGGQRLDALIGLNINATHGPLAGHRFAGEAGLPIYQDLDGPQLEVDWLLTLGWQVAF
jgi:hypothetical protein